MQRVQNGPVWVTCVVNKSSISHQILNKLKSYFIEPDFIKVIDADIHPQVLNIVSESNKVVEPPIIVVCSSSVSLLDVMNGMDSLPPNHWILSGHSTLVFAMESGKQILERAVKHPPQESDSVASLFTDLASQVLETSEKATVEEETITKESNDAKLIPPFIERQAEVSPSQTEETQMEPSFDKNSNAILLAFERVEVLLTTCATELKFLNNLLKSTTVNSNSSSSLFTPLTQPFLKK